jgi:hypothetical protein
VVRDAQPHARPQRGQAAGPAPALRRRRGGLSTSGPLIAKAADLYPCDLRVLTRLDPAARHPEYISNVYEPARAPPKELSSERSFVVARRPANITQSQIARAIRAAKQAGASGVEVRPDGTIFIHLASTGLDRTVLEQSEDIVL